MRALGVIMAAGAFLVLAPVDGVAQDDLSGMWDLTVTSDQGPNTLSITIVQDGQNLIVTGDIPELGPIEMNGTLDGSTILLQWELNIEGMPLDIFFMGTLADGEMSGTADFGGFAQGDWTAKRAEG